MKILIFSDTHGKTDCMYEAISRNRLNTDIVIHLGDKLSDLHDVMRDFPNIASIGVLGNCDFASMFSDSKYEGTFSVEGCKIFYTHGHKYNVNFGLEYLISNAKFNNANIVLFGHTHSSLFEERNGVTVINPGSISNPRDGSGGTYALLEISGDKIKCEIVEVAK